MNHRQSSIVKSARLRGSRAGDDVLEVIPAGTVRVYTHTLGIELVRHVNARLARYINTSDVGLLHLVVTSGDTFAGSDHKGEKVPTSLKRYTIRFPSSFHTDANSH